MLNLAYCLVSLLGIALLDTYFKLNIASAGEISPYLALLALATLVLLFISLWLLVCCERIVVPYSVVALVIFFVFFSYRLGVDLESWAKLKAGTIGTTGGVVLFYLLGSLVSLTTYSSDNVAKIKYIFPLVFCLISTISAVSLFVHYSKDLVAGRFLASGIDGMYQRAGSLIVCSKLLFFCCYLLAVMRLKKRFSKVLMFFVAAMNSLFMCGVAILIGSNIATVSSFGVFLAEILALRLFIGRRRHYGNLLKARARVEIYKAVMSISLLVLLLICFLVAYLDFDLSQIRLFSSGTWEIRSLSTRLELLSNFIVQFSVSPFHGFLESDTVTTGRGTYAHSFVLSLLSHLGVIGFCLFMCFLVGALTAFGKRPLFGSTNTTNYFHNVLWLLIFAGLFSISVIGTYFTAASIWFLFGLLFPLINSAGKKVEQKKRSIASTNFSF